MIKSHIENEIKIIRKAIKCIEQTPDKLGLDHAKSDLSYNLSLMMSINDSKIKHA